MNLRPEQLVYVTGTATDVGKTYVGATWLAQLAVTKAARKPVQSFSPGDRTDADVLGAATGEAADTVCPSHRWYEVPMAPPMAADVLGRPSFTIADLVGELEWPSPAVAVGLVEGVGGPRSPIARDGDGVDLLHALAPDRVILVADAGLGTINAVRLCATALGDANVTVFLNRFDATDDLHRRNRDLLARDAKLQVVTDVSAL
jgi:dethiobiotin synthetase